MSSPFDVRALIRERIKSASLRELIELSHEPEPAQPRVKEGLRFEILNENFVIDHSTGLTWLRDYVPGGARNWQDSMQAALTFAPCFRAPTIIERLSINDYERHDPALNTDVFKGEPTWEWTSTVDHSNPHIHAWIVCSGAGRSFRDFHDYCCYVRAVRAI